MKEEGGCASTKQLFSACVVSTHIRRALWMALSVMVGLFYIPVQGQEVTTPEIL